MAECGRPAVPEIPRSFAIGGVARPLWVLGPVVLFSVLGGFPPLAFLALGFAFRGFRCVVRGRAPTLHLFFSSEERKGDQMLDCLRTGGKICAEVRNPSPPSQWYDQRSEVPPNGMVGRGARHFEAT